MNSATTSGATMIVVRKKQPLPWYLKDKYGHPIEFQAGKGRMLRIVCQNIRKVVG